jgi:hypothetical protein
MSDLSQVESNHNEQKNGFQQIVDFILPVIMIAGLVAILALMSDEPVQGYSPLIPQ